MKPPSIEREFTARIVPALAALGFKRAGSKRFARVSNDVIQLLFLQVRSGLRREFMLEYCAMLAFEPRNHESLAHGGAFPVGSRSSVWYRADTEERLGRSMESVVENLPELLQWFEATASLPGFITTYAAHSRTEPPGFQHNGHTSFTFACAAAAAGDLPTARTRLQQAVSEVQGIFQAYAAEYPKSANEHWAPERLARYEELAAAIQNEGIPALFGRWREMSLANFKLAP